MACSKSWNGRRGEVREKSLWSGRGNGRPEIFGRKRHGITGGTVNLALCCMLHCLTTVHKFPVGDIAVDDQRSPTVVIPVEDPTDHPSLQNQDAGGRDRKGVGHVVPG